MSIRPLQWSRGKRKELIQNDEISHFIPISGVDVSMAMATTGLSAIHTRTNDIYPFMLHSQSLTGEFDIWPLVANVRLTHETCIIDYFGPRTVARSNSRYFHRKPLVVSTCSWQCWLWSLQLPCTTPEPNSWLFGWLGNGIGRQQLEAEILKKIRYKFKLETVLFIFFFKHGHGMIYDWDKSVIR